VKSVTFAVTVAVETDQETDAVCQKSRGLKAIDVLMQAVLRPMQIRVGRTSLVRSPDASAPHNAQKITTGLSLRCPGVFLLVGMVHDLYAAF